MGYSEPDVKTIHTQMVGEMSGKMGLEHQNPEGGGVALGEEKKEALKTYCENKVDGPRAMIHACFPLHGLDRDSAQFRTEDWRL